MRDIGWRTKDTTTVARQGRYDPYGSTESVTTSRDRVHRNETKTVSHGDGPQYTTRYGTDLKMHVDAGGTTGRQREYYQSDNPSLVPYNRDETLDLFEGDENQPPAPPKNLNTGLLQNVKSTPIGR